MGNSNPYKYTTSTIDSTNVNSDNSYVAPSYIDNTMNTDVMTTKNEKYDTIIGQKNAFFGNFYSNYATLFSGSDNKIKQDIDVETDPTSAKYKNQTSAYNTSKSSSDTGYSNLLKNSDNVQEKRLKMDADISRLNSVKNISNNNDTSILYNAYFFINILWIILATTLIYYIFSEI